MTQKIPILFVQGSAERAGAERIFYSLLKYLDRDRFKPYAGFLEEGPFVKEIENLDVEVIPLQKHVRLREVTKWRAIVDSIEGAIRSTKAAVVQGNGEKVGIWVGRAAHRVGIPSLAWLQDSPGGGGLSGWMAQLVLSRSRLSEIVTCAKWLEMEFEQKIKMETTTIMSAIDLTELPEPNESVAKISETAGWPGDSFVFGHFARLQRWKGTDYFVRAADIVRRRFPRARFLVVGGPLFGREPEWESELHDLASRLRLDDVLVFTGYRLDAIDLMASCDAVVHCSVEPDPFPTVVLEGMALSKPVIASNSRGPEEALENLETGLLVSRADEQALADAMHYLLEDLDRASDLGKRAKRVAFERFGAERMAREFEALYSRLASKPPAPA